MAHVGPPDESEYRMTGVTPQGIAIDHDFAALPETVFTALTAPEAFAQWFGGKDIIVPKKLLTYRPAPGRSWAATMVLPDGVLPHGNNINWVGEFLEVNPPTRLVMTITDHPDEPGRAKLMFQLTSIPAGTRMNLTQETPDFTDAQKQRTIAGWETFLAVMAEIAEAE